MEGILDIQRDHVFLIDSCMRLLDQDGELFFSNNQRTFSLDQQVDHKFQVEDITRRTIPEDFRDKRIHRAYIVRHRP
jgi:23S rRNA (cytosine1962-C5)-methyltransferase